jgi:hypothetical protein
LMGCGIGFVDLYFLFSSLLFATTTFFF